MPEAAPVQLVIYDVMGWNEAGIQVASGVYLYRIVAGKYIKTRKMTLLR